jgi:hypothetical protein
MTERVVPAIASGTGRWPPPVRHCCNASTADSQAHAWPMPARLFGVSPTDKASPASAPRQDATGQGQIFQALARCKLELDSNDSKFALGFSLRVSVRSFEVALSGATNDGLTRKAAVFALLQFVVLGKQFVIFLGDVSLVCLIDRNTQTKRAVCIDGAAVGGSGASLSFPHEREEFMN